MTNVEKQEAWQTAITLNDEMKENPAVDIKLKTGYESIGNRQHSRTLIITDDHYQVNIKQLHLNSHISVIFELSQH